MLPRFILRRFVLPCLVALAALTPIQVQPAAAAPLEGGETSAPGAQVVDLATQYVGAHYVFGGASPSGFDCTGFVMWVYGQFGVSPEDLQPGDVVVFANTYRAGLSHTGIYVGDGKFVHAANQRTGVVVSNVWDSYWGPRFVGASRALA